ncbi:hypothetical protein [Spirosoma endbachense]|uniref:RES domain-containing protein n=1 Tax=Spirosoma endbachense TaxID=2666025 RepID=A0A6P1W4P3_9BACT|nr:hypothetical protein [Spirosoma endbachense]QHV99302.1 hypothetical protein GJR95_31715 [Spirosoma endbachense]
MISASSCIKQLEHIRELLTHPAVDQHDIMRRVQKVFIEAGYKRSFYNLVFPAVHRAAAKHDESWFNDSDGRPVLSKLHCPPDSISSLGRCNWAGDPVFYCSSENGVPIFEVRAELGNTVALSVWVDKRNTKPMIDHNIETVGLVIGVKHIFDRLPDGDPFKTMLRHDDIFKAGTSEAIKEIDAYFGDLFIQSSAEVENLYLFTSAIARVYLNHMNSPSAGKVQALIYPSVESKLSGLNIAFNKTFARQHLKIRGAGLYTVEEHEPDKSRYSLKPTKGIANSKVDHGPIWRKFHAKHDSERYNLSPQTQIVKTADTSFLEFEDDPS